MSGKDSSTAQYMYKYVPFNDERLEILTKGTLFFSSPLKFNDPYDCKPRLILSKNPEHHPLYKQARKDSGLPPVKWLEQRPRFMQGMRDAINSGHVIESTMGNIGILSLSLKNNNMLMWSHYADLHKGFAVQLKRVKLEPKHIRNTVGNLIAYDVVYSDIRPVCLVGEVTKTATLEKLVLTKSCDWKYEDEVRVIAHKNGVGLQAYDRENLLEGVIAGARIDSENLKKLRITLDDVSNELGREIKLRQAKLSEEKFEIEIHDL